MNSFRDRLNALSERRENLSRAADQHRHMADLLEHKAYLQQEAIEARREYSEPLDRPEVTIAQSDVHRSTAAMLDREIAAIDEFLAHPDTEPALAQSDAIALAEETFAF